MKKYKPRGVLFSLLAMAILLAGSSPNLAIASGRAVDPATNNGPVLADSLSNGGRLIIHRVPALGNELIVNLTIDNQEFVSIGYGHTYETFLRPGRHVFLVRASPRPVYRDFWQMTLDVRRGQTYNFTAVIGPGSQLILEKTGR